MTSKSDNSNIKSLSKAAAALSFNKVGRLSSELLPSPLPSTSSSSSSTASTLSSSSSLQPSAPSIAVVKPNIFSPSMVSTTRPLTKSGSSTETATAEAAVAPPPPPTSPSRTPGTPRKLKKDIVADSGTVPLWFQYTLPVTATGGARAIGSPPQTENPKSYKHSLSGERRRTERGGRQQQYGDGDSSSESSPISSSVPDERKHDDPTGSKMEPEKQQELEKEQEYVLREGISSERENNGRRTSQLAATFLSKVQKSLETDLRRCVKRIPSMKVIHSVKGRWPPNIQKLASFEKLSGSTVDDNKKSVQLSHTRASKVKPSIPTKEILERFESRSGHQPSSASASLPLSSIDEDESSDHEHVATTKASSKPHVESCQRPNDHDSAEISASTSCISRSADERNKSVMNAPMLTSSIRTQNLLRSSYKIQYIRSRSPRPMKNKGLKVDSSGPDIVHRRHDNHRLDVDGTADASLPIGRAARETERSERRFDVSDHGKDETPLCFYSDHDRRFDSMDTADTMVPPGIPCPNRNYVFCDSSQTDEDIDDEYIPTIWQTRMDGSNHKRRWRLKRVWESSRDQTIVIVNKNEPDYIVDERDLEKALQTLLDVQVSLHTASTPSELLSTMSSLTASDTCSEVGRNRQWKEESRDTAPKPKDCCWRVQRVLDKDGEVVQTEPEQSLTVPALLESIDNDQPGLIDSLVWDFSVGELVPSEKVLMSSISDFLESKCSDWSMSLQDADKFSDNHIADDYAVLNDDTPLLQPPDEQGEPPDISICSEDVSFIEEDSLYDEDFNESLSSLETELKTNGSDGAAACPDPVELVSETISIDEDKYVSNPGSFEQLDGPEGKSHRFRILRKKLRKVENVIKDMQNNRKVTDIKKQKFYKKLKRKCMKYLRELSDHLSEYEDSDSHRSQEFSSPRLLDGLPAELLEAVVDDTNSACNDSQISRLQELDNEDAVSSAGSRSNTNRRDPKIVKRKLQKVERLIARMLQRHGKKKSRTRRLYTQLFAKRTKYLHELGMKHELLEFAPSGYRKDSAEFQGDGDDLTELSASASMHSLLGVLKVIKEGDDRSCEGSTTSVARASRCHSLLRRKKRKVERKMREILAERGPKAITSSKLFRRYEAKLLQYSYELAQLPEKFVDDDEDQVSSSSLSPIDNSISKLRQRVASAINVMSASSILDDGKPQQDEAHEQERV